MSIFISNADNSEILIATDLKLKRFWTELHFVFRPGERKPTEGLNDEFSKEIYSLNVIDVGR